MKKLKLMLTHLLLVAMIMSSASPATVYADVTAPAETAASESVDDVSTDADDEDADDPEADDEDADDPEVDDEDVDDPEADDEDADDPEADDEDIDDPDADDEDIDDEDMDDADDEDPEEIALLDEEPVEEDEAGDGSIKRPPVTDTREITKIDPPAKKEYTFESVMILEELLKKLPTTLTIWHEKEKNTIDIIWKCEKNYDDDLEEYPFVPDLEGYNLAKGLELPRITVRFENGWQEYPTGDIDPDESMIKNIPFTENDQYKEELDALPSSYNSFKLGKLPKVRNQGQWGTCWAHATIAAMEADLIHDKRADKSIDLSELHTAYYATNPYKDPKNCRTDKVTNSGEYYWLNSGGGMYTGMHLLSNLVGTIKESKAPYKPYAYPNFHPGKSYVTSKDVYQLSKASYYSTKDLAGIKKAVMDHGAVMTSYYHSDSYYSKSHNSYYTPSILSSGGHQIVICGWNDNFSKYNFAGGTPQGNGAWLIRNSWGLNGYGLSGYFWMSYYDTGMNCYKKGWALALDAKKAGYKHCYAYDGNVNANGFLYRSGTATQKITYKVSAGEAVKAVGVEVGDPDMSVTVTVKNKSTGKKSTKSMNCPRMGFYTVKLNKLVKVPKRATVEVTVKYKSKTGTATVPYEYPENGYWNTGVYQTTKTDKGFTLNGTKYNYDPRVKVFTVKSKAPKKVKVTGVSLDRNKVTITKGKQFKLKATVKPKNATNKKVTWKSSNTKVATVSSKGTVTARKPGSATITVKTKDQEKKARCKVTVKKKKVKVTGVSLNAAKKTLKKGKQFKLKATVKPKNATNKKVTWKSSNTKVATVSSKGTVTARKPGSATITVKTKDQKKKARCNITVKKK